MLTLQSVTYRYAGARRPSLHEVAAQVAIGFQNPATQLSG